MAHNLVDAKPTRDLRIIKELTEIKPNAMFVTLEGGTVEDVISADARNMAYAERQKHGFDNGGIEAYGGAYPIDKKGETITTSTAKGPFRYRRVYKLTRMPI